MKFLLVGLVIAACAPFAVFGQTHCQANESDYFSCQIGGSNKVVSICGSKISKSAQNKSWLQYRFGKIGEIELSYPQSKEQSLLQFEANYFNPHGEDYSVVSIRFINGKYLYDVDVSRDGDGKPLSGGVSVLSKKGKSISLTCKNPINQMYSHRMFELVGAVGREGSDLMSDFYDGGK